MVKDNWWVRFKRALNRQLLDAVAIFAAEDDYVRNGRRQRHTKYGELDQHNDPVTPVDQERREK